MNRLSILPGRAVTDNALTPFQFRLLALLCTYTNSQTDTCFPKQKDLADALGVTRQYVNQNLTVLEKASYIRREARQRADGGATTSLYFVVYDETKDESEAVECQQELTGGESPRSRQGVSTPAVDSNNALQERLTVKDSSGEDLERALLEYHAAAEEIGLPKISKLTDKRKSHLRARLADHGPEMWRAAMAAIPESEFLGGRNDRNWRPDFDWLVNPTNFAKLIEGKYHGGKVIAPQAPPDLLSARPSQAFADADAHGWEQRLTDFYEIGVWRPNSGPPPGDPGCRVPTETLARWEPRLRAAGLWKEIVPA